jgi:hypothetical protein
MAVLRQNRVGFRPANGWKQAFESKGKKVNGTLIRNTPKNGKKALGKIIVPDKALQLHNELEPKFRPYLAEIVAEINGKPTASLADVYANVLNKLNKTHKDMPHTIGAVEKVFKLAKAKGVILVE